MTMAEQAGSVRRRPVRKLETDEALIALFIGAMNTNDHVARDELARAGERRFRQRIAVNLDIPRKVATDVIDAMLLKNHLQPCPFGRDLH